MGQKCKKEVLNQIQILKGHRKEPSLCKPTSSSVSSPAGTTAWTKDSQGVMFASYNKNYKFPSEMICSFPEVVHTSSSILWKHTDSIYARSWTQSSITKNLGIITNNAKIASFNNFCRSNILIRLTSRNCQKSESIDSRQRNIVDTSNNRQSTKASREIFIITFIQVEAFESRS